MTDQSNEPLTAAEQRELTELRLREQERLQAIKDRADLERLRRKEEELKNKKRFE